MMRLDQYSELDSSASYLNTYKFIYGREGGSTYSTDFEELSLYSNYRPYASGQIQAPLHRSRFRGKYLGTSYTSAQKSAISAGTFNDLWLGDYWTINSVDWVIADFNYYGTSTVGNHVILMPRVPMLKATYHSSATLTGGYASAAVRGSSGIGSCITKAENSFGSSYIKSISRKLPTSMTAQGIATGSADYSSKAELPTESQVYGHIRNSHVSNGIVNNFLHFWTHDEIQLAIMELAPMFARTLTNESYWLREQTNSTYACVISEGGDTTAWAINEQAGVRPIFILG